jgi:preprotein translocase subunit SecG
VILLFSIILAISSTLMIVLILMHKGRGGGLSDMFGGGISSSLGGSSVAERNLDRITIGVASMWVVSIIALGMLLKVSN